MMALIKDKKETDSRRVLITGISGFIGEHLANFLAVQGWQVFGFDLHRGSDQRNLYVGDLMDRGVLANAVKESQPDVVFHLAGLIKSDQPHELYHYNLLGTVSLFESLLESGQHPKVILASSSAVYGSGFGGRPISEKFKPRPVTHYGVSKLAQEIVALRYFDAVKMPVVILRMFNLLGPGQSSDLACSAFARQIALAEVNGRKEIVTGHLETCRDFIDVQDAIRAFVLLAEKGKAGQTYNACSGNAVRIGTCLDEMLAMSPRQLKVRVDAARIQKNDIPVQRGNARKLNRLGGWHPEISLKQSLSELLDYWRQRVKLEVE